VVVVGAVELLGAPPDVSVGAAVEVVISRSSGEPSGVGWSCRVVKSDPVTRTASPTSAS
jgi:hypothetical protein